MSESKIVITERLRREGRWEEASAFKDKAIAGFRADGMKRADAAEAAWTAMAEAFPALPGEDMLIESGDSSPGLPAVEAGPIPWKDLPIEAHFDVEVKWVHQQYVLIVDNSRHRPVIRWGLATTKAPSTGACSLALWAAENRTAFYKDLLPKTMARSDELRETADTREESQDPDLNVLEAMLEQMQTHADAELLANIPEVLQDRVNQLLSNWTQEYHISLAEDSRAKLDSRIRGLINDVIRTLRLEIVSELRT